MTQNQGTKLEWRIGWGWVERPIEVPEVTEVPVVVEEQEQDEDESARAA